MSWWRKDTNGHENDAAARARAEAEARLRAARGLTPLVERMADDLALLPLGEFAERVRRAMRRA